MTLSSLLFFSPAILVGALILQVAWRERHPFAILLKLSLGIGLGLGINSILYFVSLLVSPGNINTFAIEIVLTATLLVIAILRERGQSIEIAFPRPSRLQVVILALLTAAFVMSLLSFSNVFDARPQGAFDAWNIWNRAARFIYRDPENWMSTLSPDLHILAHADYPLLVPLNVAWLWSMLNSETQRAPMSQGLLFFLATTGTLFSALAWRRTIGQAGLSVLFVLGTSVVIYVSAVLIADIPVAYYIFASSVLMYLFLIEKNTAFLVLSGFMAGLAAWTKNEGLIFVIVPPLASFLANRARNARSLVWYLAGVIIPLTVVIYFKSIAPSTEFLSGGDGALVKITDLSRYWKIIYFFGVSFFTFDDYWPISGVVVLAIYGLFMRAKITPGTATGLWTLGLILALQLMGYFSVYLLTPYDLEWHLVTSLDRLLLQLYPIGLFLFFNIISPPEEIFKRQ